MTVVPSRADWRAGPATPLGGDTYSDRARDPAETFELVRPALARLGITRVAKQTGLDRIGIPVFSALRPNARTLASSQGKGINDDAARTSATMEAIEFAFAEKPQIEVIGDASRETPHFDVTRFLPISAVKSARSLRKFVRGARMSSGGAVLVPYDLIDLDETDAEIATLSRSSNGLASGNTREEALLHGLLELIERDATTVASLHDGPARFGRPVSAVSLGDAVVDNLAAQIRDAGFEFWLFDQTSDVGVPVFQAVIGDAGRGYWRHFDLATGYGCHPNAARAAIRAMTEAAQTRVTNIAGARDDFRPTEYRMEAHGVLVDALKAGGTAGAPPRGMPMGTPTSALLGWTLATLSTAGCSEPVAVDLGGADLGIAVARVFSSDLEDRSTNRNWRPGRRALKTMLGS